MTVDLNERTQSTGDLRLTLTAAAVVYITYLFTTTRVSENLQALGLALLFVAVVMVSIRWLESSVLWAIVAAIFLLALIGRPLDMANHHWLMMYTAGAMALSLSAPLAERRTHLANNARWLLVALMGFATLQKMLQATYVDGSFFGFLIARGSFAAPLMPYLGDIHTTTQQNVELITTLRATPPGLLESVVLQQPVAGLATLALGLAAVTLVMEFWLFLSMAVWPRRLFTHVSLFVFALTLGVLRQEFTFIALVCVLGLMSAQSQPRWVRNTYAALAVLFAAGVIKTFVGSQ